MIDRNHLQAEKQLQINKSQALASKISGIRYIEQRCLKLEHKIASQQFIISYVKSQLDRLDSIYLNQIQQFRFVTSNRHFSLSLLSYVSDNFSLQIRVLKNEIGNLEELDKDKDRYFASKARDIDEFRARSEKFATERKMRVDELRNCVNEVNPL